MTGKHHPLVRRANAGFALIVTLTLMILLTVLAVGLLSLSSVALRSSSQGKAQAEARSNARMSMMLALGELQAELGPDRRVNGPAAVDEGALPEHGQWLAVYDAWSAEEPRRPEASARFRRYLVSGDRNALATRMRPRLRSPENPSKSSAREPWGTPPRPTA